jgi:hypothetical protein
LILIILILYSKNILDHNIHNEHTSKISLKNVV